MAVNEEGRLLLHPDDRPGEERNRGEDGDDEDEDEDD